MRLTVGGETYPSDAGQVPPEAVWQPEQLQALLNVALSSPDAEAGSYCLLKLLASYTNAYASAILLPHGEDERLTARVVYAPCHSKLKVGGVCGLGTRVLREQQVCVRSLADDVPPDGDPMPCQGCFRSCAAVPLRVGGSVVGVATVARVDARPFSEQELLRLDRISEVVAVALLRLLWRDSEARASKLADTLRAKGEESAVVFQELRRFLMSAAGSLNVLLNIGDRLPWEQRVANMASIRGEALDFAHEVSTLLKLSMVEAGCDSMRREPVDLESILRESVEEARSFAPRYTLVLSISESLPSVLGDPRWLKRAIMDLLQAILRSWPAGSSISLDAEPDASRVVTAVRVDGSDPRTGRPGRAATQFVALRPANEDGEQTRTLGQTICQRVIALCGGRVWAESESGGGAALFLELPVATPVD
jgi:K+-sensing histidine kinase KdpD